MSKNMNNELFSDSELENIINIKVLYNGKNIKIEINKYNKFSDFYNILEKTIPKEIKLNNYKITYKKTEIKPNDKRRIINIINEEDDEPCFILNKNNNINNHLISTSKAFVLIKNLPSFIEISNIIKEFLETIKEDINFSVDYKINSCIISFDNNENTFSFIPFVTRLKFSNPIFRKVIISLKYNFQDQFIKVKKGRNNFLNNNSSICSTHSKSNYSNLSYENSLIKQLPIINSKNTKNYIISQKFIENKKLKLKRLLRNFSN